MDQLRIVVAQINPIAGDILRNLELHKQAYEEAAKGPEYVRRVLTTAESGEPQASPGLVRLVRHLTTREVEMTLEETFMYDL